MFMSRFSYTLSRTVPYFCCPLFLCLCLGVHSMCGLETQNVLVSRISVPHFSFIFGRLGSGFGENREAVRDQIMTIALTLAAAGPSRTVIGSGYCNCHRNSERGVIKFGRCRHQRLVQCRSHMPSLPKRGTGRSWRYRHLYRCGPSESGCEPALASPRSSAPSYQPCA